VPNRSPILTVEGDGRAKFSVQRTRQVAAEARMDHWGGSGRETSGCVRKVVGTHERVFLAECGWEVWVKGPVWRKIVGRLELGDVTLAAAEASAQRSYRC